MRFGRKLGANRARIGRTSSANEKAYEDQMKLAIISYLGDCLQSWGFPNWSGARDGEDQQEIKEHLQRRSETNPTKTTKIEVEAKKRRGRGILIVNDLSFLALPLSFSISVEL